MATKPIPTEEQVIGFMDSLSNWGRWDPDDELGTLNLITPEKRAEAGSLVREDPRTSLVCPSTASLLPTWTACATSSGTVICITANRPPW